MSSSSPSSSSSRPSPSTSFTTTPTSSSMSTSLPTSSVPGFDPGPSGAGGGNGGGGGIGNPEPPTSSASLYRTFSIPPRLAPRDDGDPRLTARPFNDIAVYTFLATLVLLLSVSAAIVVRSFLLRRRHRRMVEEAIRNGTWIPPAPNGRGGPRVDLSKKPKLWEAYLDLHNQNQAYQHPHTSEERDWESMNPVMAAYISTEPATKSSSNPNAGNAVSTGDESAADSSNEAGGLAASRRFMGGFARRVRGALRTSPSGPTLPLAHPISNGTGNNTRQGSTVNLGANATGQDVQMSEISPTEPTKVRVAVLIAMPRPHSSRSSSPSSSSPASSASTSTSTSSSSSASSSPQIPTNPPTYSEEEEQLPHLEMGVAELVVSNTHQLSHLSNDEVHFEGKGKVRESMASIGSL